MKLINAWNSINFILRIFLGLVLGVVLGLLIPGNHWIAIPGTLFVWALKAIAPILVLGLVLNPLIVGIALKRNPYPLVFYCIKNSGLTAFFTRSSAANIPVNMQVCKKLGLDEDIYSVSIPLGSTINMDGAAVTITIYSLVAAASSGVQVSFPIALLLSILATFSACGASGVAGGSLLLVPVGCSLLGLPEEIAMQMVAVGFILSVVQDSMETALNSSGDALFTATAEFRKWQKQGKKLPLWSLQAAREERDH